MTPPQTENGPLVLAALADLVRDRVDAALASEGDFESAFTSLWRMLSGGLDKAAMEPHAAHLRHALGGCFVPTTFGAHRVCIDPGDGVARLGLVRRSRVRCVAEALARHVRPGSVAIDVGAHTGLYTGLLAAGVGPGGHVHAFEPLPENIGRLRACVEYNDLTERVTLVPRALSDAVGTARLFNYRHRGFVDATYAEESGALASLIESELTGEVALEIGIETLDAYCAAHGIAVLDVLKIDTEGAEARVLRGGREVIERSPSLVIALELHPEVLAVEGTSPQELLDGLRDLGFALSDPLADERRVERFGELAGTAVLATRGAR